MGNGRCRVFKERRALDACLRLCRNVAKGPLSVFARLRGQPSVRWTCALSLYERTTYVHKIAAPLMYEFMLFMLYSPLEPRVMLYTAKWVAPPISGAFYGEGGLDGFRRFQNTPLHLRAYGDELAR